MLTKVNDVIFQWMWHHSCQFQSQKFSSFFYVHLCPPNLKIVPPPMCRLPVKQMFHTGMKTLLHSGYKYLLNLLVTLVMIYKNLSFLVKSLSFELYDNIQIGQYFSEVLMEILFANGWRLSFAKLPILKLSLHNSDVCLWQKLRSGLPENITFQHYCIHLHL